MKDIERMADSVGFAISKARCRLGIDKNEVNQIEQNVLNSLADAKLKIELLIQKKGK